MAAGEVKDPQRNIPLALVIGVVLVFFLYGAANLAYFYALPISEIVSSRSSLHPEALPVATKAAATFLGGPAVTVLSLAFVVSALGAMHGSILTGSRVPYSMADAGLFPRFLAKVSGATRVPVMAVLVQGIWACVLAASGSFDQLTDYVVFASWIFYMLNGFAVLRLRKKLPQQERRYKVPLYPWVPLLFCLTSLLLLANTLYTAPRESGIGLGLILLGLPAYLIFRKRA